MMPLPEGINTLAGRLATFDGPRRLTKRRASAAKKKGANNVEWPHNTPTPEQLARAGFFYQPTSSSNDNVQCFICHRQLDGWEAEDNPAYEHVTHSEECGWAVNAAINQRVLDGTYVDEDPLSQRLTEARHETFKDSWPHEAKKGWKCKTKKMVEAGWCYDPSPEYDDGVQCFYCNLSLDGWEPKDNALEEHRKRSPDCPFFALVDQFAPDRKATRGKGGRTSKASVKSRQSTQSNVSVSEAPSYLSLGNATAQDDDTVLTNATAATTTSMASKRGKAKAKAPAKGTRKTTRRKNTANTSTIEQDLPAEDHVEEEAQPAAPAARATRGRKRNTTQTDMTVNASTINPTTPPRRVAGPENTGAEHRMSDDESQLQSELVDAVHRASSDGSQIWTRGTKRTSDGVPKIDSSIVILEDPPPPVKVAPKPTKAKKGAKKGVKMTETQSSHIDHDMVDAPEGPVKPAPKPKAGRKGKKVKSPSPEPEAEPNYEDDFDDEMELHDTNLENFPAPPSSAARPPPAPSPQPPSIITPRQNKVTPSPSPQSSDAENVPPSARPSTHPASLHRQGVRVPLAPLAGTPVTSPSKRNVITGGLASAFPWEPIDLETIFLMPEDEEREFRALHGITDNEGLDQENAHTSGAVDEMVRRVKSSLTSPEKKMTVEQWIRFNADRGEQRLRAECERLVGIFETQGSRAMRAIEGIECTM